MKHALSLTALLLAAPLSAQVPKITPAGDPTVLADTIYALGVALADAEDRDELILLDDGVVVVEHDGTGSTTYRTIAQVLTLQQHEDHQDHH